MSTTNPKAAFLIVGHGSRVNEANDELKALAGKIQGKIPQTRVACAFLAIAKPSIEAAIDLLTGEGIGRITLLPFFLSRGQHTMEHIPAIVESKKVQYPGIAFEIKEPLGVLPQIVDLIIKTYAHAR